MWRRTPRPPLSVRKLAVELTAAGHPVSHETVTQLLRAQGFSLQANVKTIEGTALDIALPPRILDLNPEQPRTP
jgi:hypothetical protein